MLRITKSFLQKNFYIRKILKITKNKIAIRQKILFLFHRREKAERLRNNIKVNFQKGEKLKDSQVYNNDLELNTKII